MGFGSDLRGVRLERGLKLRQLAKLLGVSPAYLSKIEREDAALPSIDKCIEIAKILELDSNLTQIQAGHIPKWMIEIIKQHPGESVKLLRGIA